MAQFRPLPPFDLAKHMLPEYLDRLQLITIF